MKRTGPLLLFFIIAAVLVRPAVADDIVYDTVFLDPATLHVGNPPAGGDPNQITTNEVQILQNSGGAATLNNPWLVILGVPNTATANPFGAGITTSGFVQVAANSSTATPTSWAYLGLSGTMGTGQEAYTQLGLDAPGVDMSNNFVNWSGADSSLAGINATSFGLYEFQVWADLAAKGTVTLNFGDLPGGTIIIAWGQTSSTSSSQSCLGHGRSRNCTTTITTTYTTYDTPFTEAAFRDNPPPPPPPPPPPVPEPASMLLLGSGILSIAGLKKKFRK